MGSPLAEMADAFSIPSIDSYEELGLAPEAYDELKIFGLVESFAAVYGDELVLYGGQTATARIWGFKRIRDITHDLDFVCTRAGLERAAHLEKLLYHSGYDIFFSSRDNVPLSFALEHIHDWPVDEGIFRSARPARGFRCAPLCCSPEYSMMLKMRRTSERFDQGLHPFGKDALDIINMATAPYIRDDLAAIDFPSLAALLRASVSSDGGRLAELGAFVAGYAEHLTERERGFFSDAWNRFAREVVR